MTNATYRIGTLAFCVGTAVWGVEAYREGGAVDPAAAAYALGCLYFVDDAFRPGAKHSYRTGSIAYTLGTVVWGVQSWHATHQIDLAAALYLLGCLYFLLDAFGVRIPGLSRVPITSLQLGALAFLAGTAVWAVTSGISIPVGAYGLGCVCFVKDAFRKKS